MSEPLADEQTASIAQYKKMYDRSSALAKIGVWECDLATEALTWTDGVYDLFELPRGSPVERDEIVKLYDEESRLEMERLRARAIRDGDGFSLDVRVRTAKGNERWLHLTGDVEFEDGRPVRIFGTKQDISQRKAAQEEVRALQAELIHASRRSAMGAMAATLAHELNQPLAAISNYVAGTRRALGRPDQPREALVTVLDAIERNAFRASNIIRSLRGISNGSVPVRRRLNAHALIREAASIAANATGGQATISYDLADDAVVMVDPVQIQQVFINLLKNAFEAVQTSSRREISVTSMRKAGAVEIRFDDSGSGIPSNLLETLFDSGPSSKPDGMGVGLSICRTIVEAHGGRIAAANRQTGGASFCITLPAPPADG